MVADECMVTTIPYHQRGANKSSKSVIMNTAFKPPKTYKTGQPA